MNTCRMSPGTHAAATIAATGGISSAPNREPLEKQGLCEQPKDEVILSQSQEDAIKLDPKLWGLSEDKS